VLEPDTVKATWPPNGPAYRWKLVTAITLTGEAGG
jgi:hypothetical protein